MLHNIQIWKILYLLFQLDFIKQQHKKALHMHTPTFKYQQIDYHSCFLIRIAYALFVLNKFNA